MTNANNDEDLTIELQDVLHDIRATRDKQLQEALSINAGRILTNLRKLLDAQDYEYVVLSLELKLPEAEQFTYLYQQSLAEWREYLADSLAPLISFTALEAQKDFAKYQTGGRIIEMEEHLDQCDVHQLLLERGLTPERVRDYKRRFLAEASEYVKSNAMWRKERNLD